MMPDGPSGEHVVGPGTVLDALRDYGVVQLSATGVVLSASAGAAALTDRPREALPGVAFRDLFEASGGRPGLMARVREALRADGAFRDELQLRRTEGDGPWVA